MHRRELVRTHKNHERRGGLIKGRKRGKLPPLGPQFLGKKSCLGAY